MKEVIVKIFKDFCKETKRSGGVLVHSSISEWNNYLAEKLEKKDYDTTSTIKTNTVRSSQ